MKVLVTGGTGTLGREVIRRLTDSHRVGVRSLSRHVPDSKVIGSDYDGVEWLQGDLETGKRVEEAVANVDTVIHTATGNGKNPKIDIEGTKFLLIRAREAGVSHFIYISIVGADRIPVGYLHTKLEAEELVKEGGVPWSLLRATQFHSLIDGILQGATRVPPFAILPTFVNQPIDSGEVANRLCELVTSGPSGRLPDLGGPEVLTGRELLREWLKVRKMKRLTIPIWLPGKMGRGLRAGYATCPESPCRGTLTWSQWVSKKYVVERPV
jgi:uncharacterized protein YbjT (DUF2867 family)